MNRQKTSTANILHRILSRQQKLEDKVNTALEQGQNGPAAGHNFDYSAGQSNVQRHGTGKRPEYSLAGPRGPPPSDQYHGYVDPDYKTPNEPEEGSKPVWGLAKPLPRVSRNKKTKKSKRSQRRHQDGSGSVDPREQQSKHPKGQVGGGPAGHNGAGDETQGEPQGESAGGPATTPRRQGLEDQDEFIEHFADGLVNPLAEEHHRKESQDTLVDDTSDEEDEEEQIPNYWFALRRKFRELFSEFLATMILVFLGTCGNLQVKLSQGDNGNYTQSALVWGFATMISIYIAGGVSGAHCNPSVSIFLCIFRGFPSRKAALYIVAQICGALVGVALAYGIYYDGILNFDPQLTSTSSGSGTAFFTLPNTFVQPTEAFFTDFVSAAIQAGAVLAIGDDSNAPPGAGMHAFIIGLIAFVLASTLGYNTGPQTNMAKDLATRFVAWAVGYQPGMWARAWWAEAWAASIGGGIAGALIYDVFIFEGYESPINFPRHKRKEAYHNKKQKVNLWGKLKGRNSEAADEEVGLEKTDSVPRL